MSDFFYRVRLNSVPSQIESEVTEFCFQQGSTGLSEALKYSQPDLTYDPRLTPVKSRELDVYFTQEPDSNFFEKLRFQFPQVQAVSFKEESKDWLEEWKKGFVAFNLAGPYWIVPSWHQSPTSPEFTIAMDPGMAFGSGTHATTQMAAYFVHRICSQLKSAESTCLLDVGTGTGILAILAAKMGVGEILGLEIDPEARRVATENIALNQVTVANVSLSPLEEVAGVFDIVIANIIDGVLIQLREQLVEHVAPNGNLFVTGILLERETLFIEKFIDLSNCKIHRRIEKDEWVGYWLIKNPS